MPAAPDDRVKSMIRLFVRMYEDGAWEDANLAWPDEERDGAVDGEATRPDGGVLAIEHTLIEPFDGNRDEFERLRRFFLPMFPERDFIVPGVATYVDVSREALRLGAPCAALAKNLNEWTRRNIDSVLVDGRTTIHRIPGAGRCPEFEVTVRRQRLSGSEGFFLVRRFGKQNVGEVVEKALKKKLHKLVAADAQKRVLFLERQDWRLDEREILTEMRLRGVQWPDLDHVDEIWMVETTPASIADPTDFIDFKLYDERGLIARSFAFLNGSMFDHSRDGMPVPIQRANPPGSGRPTTHGEEQTGTQRSRCF